MHSLVPCLSSLGVLTYNEEYGNSTTVNWLPVMIFEEEKELKARIMESTGRNIRGPVKISSDTTDFMRVEPEMVLRLEGNDYFIRSNATEGRFGIDEQPKFWVKYAIDLETGEKKVLKLVFYEDYASRIGPFLLRAHRDPEKESNVLDSVREHPHFMQGRTIRDQAGNLIRVINFVRGKSLYKYLPQIKSDHETYFFEMMPAILTKLLDAFKAMAFLMSLNKQHGDIRSDHLIIDADTGRYVWIDFDFKVSHSDYDLWCLGNVFTYVIGKGNHMIRDVQLNPTAYPGIHDSIFLAPEDSLFVSKGQIANLGKLYPYIPEKINNILANFSIGTDYFYEDINILLDHLHEALNVLPPPQSQHVSQR